MKNLVSFFTKLRLLDFELVVLTAGVDCEIFDNS